ncbi:MAG: hypothetical protein LBP59_11395 [Planctomycetaceae bacterium]|jgi:nicotinic acid mononucleotide adenylyltransferase|nr:hypothetical protein [Planctomycetaceae bacterium]
MTIQVQTDQQINPTHDWRVSLIQSINRSNSHIVLALTGGGQVLGDLLSFAGISATLLEATVTYSPESMHNYIGYTPDQYCCRQTACQMAMTAFNRSIKIIRTRKNNQNPNTNLTQNLHDNNLHYANNNYSQINLSRRKIQQHDQTTLDDFSNLIGVGCAVSLATNYEKRGGHRVYVAVQTLRSTFAFSLELNKDERMRNEEDRLVADLILGAIGVACDDLELWRGKVVAEVETVKELDNKFFDAFEYSSNAGDDLKAKIPLALKSGETVESLKVVASPLLLDLFFGKSKAVLWSQGKIRYFQQNSENKTPDTVANAVTNTVVNTVANTAVKSDVLQTSCVQTDSVLCEDVEVVEGDLKSGGRDNVQVGSAADCVFNRYAEYMQAIFPGAFNPVHLGHLGMKRFAERRLGCRVALEISISNTDKPMVDYIDLWFRLCEIERACSDQIVWLTQTPLFEEKSEIFRGATFIVGADTLRRFADVCKYYRNTHHLHDVLRIIAYYDCRFLVFARRRDNITESLNSLNIPDMLRSLCDEVLESEFTENISSTELRKKREK